MEIADLDASVAPLISRLLSIFELGRFSAPQTLWKWGALLLTLMYAFSSVVRKIKLLVVQRHRRLAYKLYSSSSEPLLASSDDDDFDFSDEDDEEVDDDARSSCSSDVERRELDPAPSSYENLGGFFEDFRVAGSMNSWERKRELRIRRRRSLSGDDDFSSMAELVSGKGVVKLWDGLGFGGFHIDDSEEEEEEEDRRIYRYDVSRNMRMRSSPLVNVTECRWFRSSSNAVSETEEE